MGRLLGWSLFSISVIPSRAYKVHLQVIYNILSALLVFASILPSNFTGQPVIFTIQIESRPLSPPSPKQTGKEKGEKGKENKVFVVSESLKSLLLKG